MAPSRSKTPPDIAALELQYAALAPRAETLCAQLRTQLDALLHSADLALGFPIQSRVKSWPSIRDKLERGIIRVTQLSEMQDVAGLRIVLQFRRDLSAVDQLLHNTLKVLRQYDTQARLNEDQFGYSSVHYVVELSEGWLSLPTMHGLQGIQAEIQVRTLAQHIWAATSHTLQYGREQSVPTTMRRAVNRVAALLETVDLEFDRLLKDRDEYREQVSTAAVSEVDTQLDVDLVERVLLDLLPRSNKKGNEDYSSLLADLNKRLGVVTVSQLRALWGKFEREAMEEEREYVGRGDGTKKDRANGVYFSHAGLVRNAIEAAERASWRPPRVSSALPNNR